MPPAHPAPRDHAATYELVDALTRHWEARAQRANAALPTLSWRQLAVLRAYALSHGSQAETALWLGVTRTAVTLGLGRIALRLSLDRREVYAYLAYLAGKRSALSVLASRNRPPA